jgi:hypothetical protein
VFSEKPLTFDLLLRLFSDDSSIVVTREWLAYPLYNAPENLSTPFRMAKGHSVFNTSVIEWGVSAMEISAISGRNISLLIQKDFEKELSNTPNKVLL